MASYGNFADVYDKLMSSFDYKQAAEYLVSLAKKHGGMLEKPLDLACGSGSLAAELENLGLDPVCVDGSPEVLSIARERLGSDALLLCQDMTELDLNDTVDTCFCTMDSINYITSKNDLKKAFERLALFTDRDGLFIFDVNTEHKFLTELCDATYTYDLDNLYLIWCSEYDRRTKRSLYEITWFSKGGGGWTRSDDEQEQRYWSDAELKELLGAVGFIFVASYDAYTERKPKATSERIHYVFRKA